VRGSGKSQITSDVSQQGQNAMSVISNTLVNSLGLASATNYTGTVFTSASTPALDCSRTLALGGAQNVSMRQIVVNDFEAGVTHTLTCENTGQTTIELDGQSLIDTAKLRVTAGAANCYFRCTAPNAFTPPRVEIFFVIREQTGATFTERQSTANMQSSVMLRNTVN
jgi:hypothetical protein